jgi:hypothetical protein
MMLMLNTVDDTFVNDGKSHETARGAESLRRLMCAVDQYQEDEADAIAENHDTGNVWHNE